MLEEHYPFVAQPLPYEYDALLPVLDEETLHFHHDRHYQTYVDKLNATLADYPQLQQMSLTELRRIIYLRPCRRKPGKAFTITVAVYIIISCILTVCEARQDRSPVELWRRRWSGILDR